MQGLSCAYELSKKKLDSIVIERSDDVGGLSKSFNRRGFIFDIGPHVYKDRNKRIRSFWQEVAGSKFEKIEAKSSILFEGKYFASFSDLFLKVSKKEAIKRIASLLKSRAFPYRNVKTSKEWVTNVYGRELYEKVYLPHEMKLWGVHPSELDVDWARVYVNKKPLYKFILNRTRKQLRIKNDNAGFSVLWHPDRGSGEIFEEVKNRTLKTKKTKYLFENSVFELNHDSKKIIRVLTKDAKTNRIRKILGEEFVATIPLQDLIFSLRPKPPEEILNIASKLKFRGIILVKVIYGENKNLPVNWIEIHSPEIMAGRITDYGSLSKKMQGNKKENHFCLEYYSDPDKKFWKATDENIKELASRDLTKMGFQKDKIKDIFVVRFRDAYPTYFKGYMQDTSKL